MLKKTYYHPPSEERWNSFLNVAKDCAARNGYALAKRIVGIVKINDKKMMEADGAAYQPGRISTIVTQAGSMTLPHELGHNFGNCHVYGTSVSFICGVPKHACEPDCPNLEDCNRNVFSRTTDVMSYCVYRKGYAPAAYRIISRQCELMQSSSQQLLTADVTVNRDGIAEVNSLHIIAGEIDTEDNGNYLFIGVDKDGQIYEEDFHVNFELHADVENEDGTMSSIPFEVDQVDTLVSVPYSWKIDGIEIIDPNGNRVLPEYQNELSEIVAQNKLFYEGSEGSVLMKVLPDDAKLIADIDDVTDIELIEENGVPVYDIKGIKQKELFGWTLPLTAEVEAKVSAENGYLLEIEKPWWL